MMPNSRQPVEYRLASAVIRAAALGSLAAVVKWVNPFAR